MLWSNAQLDKAFLELRDAAVSSCCTVLILVAPDCDALCACRIFTTLLRCDHIGYKIKPVAGYADIERVNHDLIEPNDELRSIVFINCGGSVDLSKWIAFAENRVCYVLDSHRPVHLANLHSGPVRVLADQELDKDENIPSDGSDLSGEEERDASESEDSEDGLESEDEARKEVSPSASRKRPRRREPRSARKQARRDKLVDYYFGSGYGAPAAHTAYELAQQLNRDSNFLLWLAIVGVTDQFLHRRVSDAGYEALVQRLFHEVQAKNPEQPGKITWEDGTTVKRADVGRISFEEEFRFSLHRHWSLYDAMYHSPFVAARIGSWQPGGKQRLDECLAKLGFSLDECRQQYALASLSLKQRLGEKLEAHAEEFNLMGLVYGSFSRTLGFGQSVSAADVAQAVTALLESGTSEGAQRSKGATDAAAAAAAAATSPAAAAAAAAQRALLSGGGQSADDTAAARCPSFEMHFNLAYDALGRGGRPVLQRGIQSSMRLQRTTVETGMYILERELITKAARFRYTILDAAPDAAGVLTPPLALTKLALFVITAHREQGKWIGSSAHPYVLCVRDEARGVYVVVGVTYAQRRGQLQRNTIGLLFQEAAEKVNATYKHDGFDAAVIEVAQGDVKRFFAALSLRLSEQQ